MYVMSESHICSGRTISSCSTSSNTVERHTNCRSGSPFRLAVSLYSTLTHEACYSLLVEYPCFTPQLMRDPLITLLLPCSCRLFEGLQQPLLLPCCWSVIVATVSAAEYLAHHPKGILLSRHSDHRPFLLKGEFKSPEAFFVMSSFIMC